MDFDVDVGADTSDDFDDGAEAKKNVRDRLRKPEASKEHRGRKCLTKHMKLYPELYRSDVSINPSYSGLKNLPYHVVCRHRIQRLRKQINQQLNREITHIAMMQMFAIDSVRIDQIFSIGASPKRLTIPDFATDKERRRINDLLRS